MLHHQSPATMSISFMRLWGSRNVVSECGRRVFHVARSEHRMDCIDMVLFASQDACGAVCSHFFRRRRREVDVEEKRASNPLVLVQVGELSSARPSRVPTWQMAVMPLCKSCGTPSDGPMLRANLFLKIYAIWCQSSKWVKTSSCERCGHPDAVQRGDLQA